MYTPAGTKIKRASRPRWAIVLKYEGETVYTSNGKRFLSNATHMVILPKGCSYEWECTRAGHYAILEFESDMIHHEPRGFFIKITEKILKIFRELEYKRNLNQPMAALESIRDAYTVILMLQKAQRKAYYPMEKMQKIQPAMAYISQNFNKEITNDTLAALTGLSTVYFRKLFTQMIGVSPIAYVHQIRIQKAKEMLKSDYSTLSDIAQSLGYPNLYDFSRTFKKHVGVAPSKYEANLY